jgi:hypothetical protein
MSMHMPNNLFALENPMNNKDVVMTLLESHLRANICLLL